MRIRLLVRALCAKRIIGVGKPDSMGVRGDLITRKTVRITGPIPPLMMMPAKVVGIAEGWVFDDCRNGGQNTAALDGVCFHQFKFFSGKLCGFVQDRSRKNSFSNVVERGQHGECVNGLVIQIWRQSLCSLRQKQ